MKILELVDKHLEKPYIERSYRRSGAHHPSQASCVIKNEYDEQLIAGACLRTIYWENKGVKKTNPMTARGKRITRVGKMVEQHEVEQYKQIGIWRANNVKFFNDRYRISGEADCLVFDKGRDGLLGIEIKTGYDYKFRKEVIGTSTRKGRPKFAHLLQTMLYIDHFKIPFKMVYIDRGNAARAEYDITLNSDGTANIDGKKLTNGISIPSCLARYKEVDDCLEDGTLPKRDFQLKYSKEYIGLLHESGRLNKGQTKEFERNKDVDMGDWQCGYCDYKDYCWDKHKE